MKRLIKNHWPLIAIGGLLIVVGLYLINARNEIIQKPAFSYVVSDEGVKLKDIHYTQDNPDEGIKWVLDAREVSLSEDRQFITFRNFRLKLEPKNRPSIELVGEKGDYDKKSGEINLWGDLKGYSDNGYRIITEHVMYKQKENYLKTDEPVKIIGPYFSVEGGSLYLDLEKEILRVISGVTTSINRRMIIL